MTRFGIAAFAAAGAMTISGSATGQPFEQCKGPFAKCVQEVGGWCESNGKGGQSIVFYDKAGGYRMAWEACVGRVYEEHGRPNPYRPSSSQKPASQPAR